MKFRRNFGIDSFPWIKYRQVSSTLANSSFYAAIWMQTVLAINRFFAVSYPILYSRVFNRRNAWITVIALWLCSTLIAALYYNFECKDYFESVVHSWSTLYGPCNHAFLAYAAMLLSDFIIFISAIIDAMAFYRVISYIKEKRSQDVNGVQQGYGHEIIFFKETCVSTAIHATFAALFRVNVPLSRLTKITYIWLSILTLDGLAFVYFNRRFLIKQNVQISAMGLRTKTAKTDARGCEDVK
ncbi:unnamed protein product [Cercopithifilaria johnstoni]|uniref:G-protein coupled receptors family 1 profile domain-containing protein n=1 Tax=Cercopithifilaria johnstoni TaxID=2874296 RepID=A0A8J2M5T4_9BILA|nr:unnamed protein product [Cercopithifilaria johnstoni]